MTWDDLPEEMKAAIVAEVDRTHMETEALRSQINGLFDGLTKEELVALRKLFRVIVNAPRRHQTAILTYYDGQAATTLRLKYEVCEICGVDHYAEGLRKVNEQAEADNMNPSATEVVGQMPLPEDMPNESVPDLPNIVAWLDRWNVEPEAGTDPDAYSLDMPVTCKGCGTRYVSLRDRMVKPAGLENCEGCVHKVKWG